MLVDSVVALARAEPDVLLTVVGPTASGKTALAVALAERLGGAVISADSVQVYRGFDVGSGKPSVEERARAPHFLVDIAEPLEAIDAVRFATMADTLVSDLRARGLRPIVCGGTFLWVKALLQGLAPMPAGDEAVRARHRGLVESEGPLALHACLAAVDVVSAARLHPNDVVRVGRALEVFELTGRPASHWIAEHGFRTVRHRARLVGLARAPEELTSRIEARARTMLEDGWIEETRSLLASGFASARAMGAVGYRQIRAYLEGQLAEAELLPSVVRATRIFARKQRTWLGHVEVSWL